MIKLSALVCDDLHNKFSDKKTNVIGLEEERNDNNSLEL